MDLFSGIGGFALAAKWAGYKTVAFVEIDKYCQKVLAKHWPGVPIYDDIKKIQWVVTNSYESRTGEQIENIHRGGLPKAVKGFGFRYVSDPEDRIYIKCGRIDLLTGGFPCQPFSCAGKRSGTEDDRYLWHEMLRAIHEVKPRWILAENVPGILSIDGGLVFEGVCADLEAEGYEVLPLVIPACAKGAPHRRDRVWIVAHLKNPINGRMRGWKYGFDKSEGEQLESEIQVTRSDRRALDTAQELFNGSWNWQESWYEVATRLCRVDDGIPRIVDRANRLRAMGNAIVPQVAYEIIRCME